MKRIGNPGKPRNLTCCCCGNTTLGRQWHNRDLGYGLCPRCADWIRAFSAMSPEDFERYYGREGEHYNLSHANQPAEV